MKFLKKNWLEVFLLFIFFVFSSVLMWKTFRVTPEGDFKIASKVWSDFGATIPLIRSFTYGKNFPVEHPLFPGEPIRYHYLYYLIVGIIERIGVRIDFALNILSSISFAFLLFMVYLFGKNIFKNTAVGILSVVLFLFNGSLSFIEFFKLHSISINTFSEILKNKTFPSFGPYDGNIVSAFWNLNIYTNQRHLALSFLITLLIIYLLFYKFDPRKILKYLVASILLCILLVFLNKAALLIAFVFIGYFILVKPKKRIILVIPILISVVISLLSTTAESDLKNLVLAPGFLVERPLTFASFTKYWFYNLGLYFLLIPLACIFSPKNTRILILPTISLFIFANIFRFSNDMINNHKFFNFFLIITVMITANFLITIWSKVKGNLVLLIKPLIVLTTALLTLSGVIDLAAVLNDFSYTIPDIPNNKDAQFFLMDTDPKDVVLNSRWFYHPASLAGRPIFHGYSYFTWSYGYDQTERERKLIEIYQAPTKDVACKLLRQNNISYVDLYDKPEEYLKPNWKLWEGDFVPIYTNNETEIKVYEVKSSCASLSS